MIITISLVDLFITREAKGANPWLFYCIKIIDSPLEDLSIIQTYKFYQAD